MNHKEGKTGAGHHFPLPRFPLRGIEPITGEFARDFLRGRVVISVDVPSVQQVAQRLTARDSPDIIPGYYPFKDDRGRRDIHGTLLSMLGYSDSWIRMLEDEDRYDCLAHELGISKLQACMLEHISHEPPQGSVDPVRNIFADNGIIADILVRPERFLGEHAQLILSFATLLENYTQDEWRRLMTQKDPWRQFASVLDNLDQTLWRRRMFHKLDWEIGRDSMYIAAMASYRDAFKDYKDGVGWEAGDFASNAVLEIQIHKVLGEEGRELVYLPLFSDTEAKPVTIEWLRDHPREILAPKDEENG